jgi:hypothetical protein
MHRELDEYCRFLQSDEDKRILDTYHKEVLARSGGDSRKAQTDLSFLLKTLRWLKKVSSPPHTPDPQAVQKMERFLRVVEAIPDMPEMKGLDPNLKNKTQTYTDAVRGDLQAYLTIRRQRPGIVLAMEIFRLAHEIFDNPKLQSLYDNLKGKDQKNVDAVRRDLEEYLGNPMLRQRPARGRGMVRKLKQVRGLLKLPLRRRGHRPESLAAAVVVAEFKKTFRRPRYREAAILLCEASPTLCETLTDKKDVQEALQVIDCCRSGEVPKRLERIVKRVPSTLVECIHNNLLNAPDPLTMICEVRPYTPSPFDTTKSL